MNRKLLAFWHQIRSLVQYAQVKTYRQILGLILLALLGFISTISVPALSAQQLEGTSGAIVPRVLAPLGSIAQTSNAHLLLQQGIKLFESERFPEAVAVWQKAASAFAIQKDNLNLALVLSNLSSAYQELGQWKEAEGAITQSLNLLTNLENLANSQTYLEILAKALNNQGSLEWAKGHLDAALLSWRKATTAYAKARNQTGIIGSSINQAQALQALGLSRQAEETLEKASQILKQESNLSLKATGLRNLGNALRRVGRLEDSRQFLVESLQLTERPTARSLALLELGNTERALANRAIARRKEDESQKHSQAAIESYQQAAMHSDSAGQLQAQLNQLSFLVEMGQRSEAAELLPSIRKAIANLPASRTAIYARLNFAQSLTCLQPGIDREAISCVRSNHTRELKQQVPQRELPSWQEIAQILATAVQQARSLQDLRSESYALGQLGELYELIQQYQEAQNLTEQAILRIEEIQAPDIRYRWEWQLGRVLEKQGDTNRALAAYTTSVETLKSVRGNLLTINPDVQFSFRDNIEPIYRRLVDLLLRTDGTSQPSQENLKQAIKQIDSLQLAELENFLQCNLSSSVQIGLEDIESDPKAAFIYPIILEDRLAVISKLPEQSLEYHQTLISRNDVENTLSKLQGYLSESSSKTRDVIKQSKEVYKWLVKPLEPALERNSQVETLVFVLDGSLRNIPMTVLYDGERKQYLLQNKYAIAISPRLQLFTPKLSEQRLQVFVGGVGEQQLIDGIEFPKIENLREELEGIGNKMAISKPLLNADFTQLNLQQQLKSGNFSAVHLKTHGEFSSDPEGTFIVAYQKLIKARDLAELISSDSKGESGNIELLVLSACKTAQGDNRAVLGLAGLAVRAGARSTLSTLWEAQDIPNTQLMLRFYEELSKPGMTKARALHIAQQDLFESYPAPYFWATYVLVGNWL